MVLYEAVHVFDYMALYVVSKYTLQVSIVPLVSRIVSLDVSFDPGILGVFLIIFADLP